MSSPITAELIHLVCQQEDLLEIKHHRHWITIACIALVAIFVYIGILIWSYNISEKIKMVGCILLGILALFLLYLCYNIYTGQL